MASKTLFVFCAQALLIQAVYGQYVGSGSTVTGNSVVDNNIYIGGYGAPAGLSVGAAGAGLGIGAAGAGLGIGAAGAGLGVGAAGAGLGVGAAGVGLGAGLGVSSGLGSGVLIGGLPNLSVGSSGPLVVTNISPIGPSGLAVASENAIDGVLAVSGQLPFLSAVTFEGSLPSAGSGTATCGCGSGSVGIVSEGFPQPAAAGLGLGGLGLGSGIGLGLGSGLGLGAGLLY